mmetsp:Transcript_44078/g.108207  ORF Transcript_44078/g.108207 Transcript_44078/m.108207 type:complete len:249 (-) Transcript_44078:373-1119(-)
MQRVRLHLGVCRDAGRRRRGAHAHRDGRGVLRLYVQRGCVWMHRNGVRALLALDAENVGAQRALLAWHGIAARARRRERARATHSSRRGGAANARVRGARLLVRLRHCARERHRRRAVALAARAQRRVATGAQGEHTRTAAAARVALHQWHHRARLRRGRRRGWHRHVSRREQQDADEARQEEGEAGRQEEGQGGRQAERGGNDEESGDCGAPSRASAVCQTRLSVEPVPGHGRVEQPPPDCPCCQLG